MKITRAKTNAAFTLLEMILAIGVAAIVLAVVSTTLFAALHLRDATADAVDAASPVDQAMAILRRDLQCAVTPKPSGVLSGDFKTGSVTSTGISVPVTAEIFTATGALSANAPWGDIQRVTYELKASLNSSAAGQALYRSITRNLLAVSTPEVTEQLMLNGVASLKFSCYDGTQWNDAWDTTDPTSINTNLPAAVRVDIQMAGNAAMQPIEIVVPIDSLPRTSTNAVAVVSSPAPTSTGGGGGTAAARTSGTTGAGAARN